MDEFTAFWARFPRKTGKLAAMKAYQKARRMATAEQIIDGVDRYIHSKPSYADWCMPTTFLNQGRWLDEPDQSVGRLTLACPHDPPCDAPGRWKCQQKTALEAAKRSA